MTRVAVCLTSIGLVLAACATAPSETAPPEAVAAQVVAEVCWPYVVEGASLAEVKRALDAGWSQDWPELLTSRLPGVALRQRHAATRGVIMLIPDNPDIAVEIPQAAKCNVVVRGAGRARTIAAIEAALTGRVIHRRTDLHGFVVADWCVTGRPGRGATVWVLDYGDGRTGAAVHASAQAQQGC